MNEVGGPLSAIVLPFAEAVANRRLLTPQQKSLGHASCAAMLLAWWGYLPVWLVAKGTQGIWIGTCIWFGVGILGALWLLAAWNGAQGPRDCGVVFRRLVLAVGCSALLWWHVQPPDWGPLTIYLLRGFYWACLAAHLVRFMIAARLFGGGKALGVLNRHIRKSAVVLRPAIRPWWRFW
jgi:hypothetical protein